jgi:DNA processing protein
MNIKKLTLNSPLYPEPLRHIASPPKQIYVAGAKLSELLKRPCVTVVGPRRVSPYGQKVTRQFARELAEQGVVIVSGLAYGVDALAHRSALEVGGQAIAVLPSPVDNIMPRGHWRLAEQIIEQGGALVSEYGSEADIFKTNFVARNRIMAGLVSVVLVTEATIKSGALHTANFALDSNRDVFVVPANIDRPASAGSNNLLASTRAAAAPDIQGILHSLKITPHRTRVPDVRGRNADEQAILDLLLQGVSEGDQLLEQSGLEVSLFNQTLTLLEISCKIRPLGANHWALY